MLRRWSMAAGGASDASAVTGTSGRAGSHETAGASQTANTVTICETRVTTMAKTPAASEQWTENTTSRQIHLEQLRRAELFNGRAAMVGIVIGVVVEGLTGFGIMHQIGLGALVDGYAACRTQFLPFCF